MHKLKAWKFNVKGIAIVGAVLIKISSLLPKMSRKYFIKRIFQPYIFIFRSCGKESFMFSVHKS